VSLPLPAITSREAGRALQKQGFVLHHHTGSHAIYYCEQHRCRVVVPEHAGRTLKPKILHSIIGTMGTTVEGFLALL
jgi:predicted RNA binding protein YcfA (HicA-like mRNA interferase family)